MPSTPQLALTLAIAVSALLAIRAHSIGAAGRWQAYLFKPLTTVLILALAILTPSTDSRYQLAVGVGLVLSLAGDVFLMLPRDRFLPGLVSFLLAHVAYLIAFTRGLRYEAAALPFVAYGLVGAALFALLWPGLSHRLRTPVGVYVVVITLMAGVALARWLELGGPPPLAAAVGAGFFVVSDALLALDRFRWSFRSAQAAVLGTYWAAQYLIAVSVGS
jgi:uncharacterized membrane protein YhhN